MEFWDEVLSLPSCQDWFSWSHTPQNVAAIRHVGKSSLTVHTLSHLDRFVKCFLWQKRQDSNLHIEDSMN